MEPPAATICSSAWGSLSAEIHRTNLVRSDSNSLSSCSSSWQYIESADSDDSDKGNCTFVESMNGNKDCNSWFGLNEDVIMKKKEATCQISIEPIDPPIEFQDVPACNMNRAGLEELAEGLVDRIVCDAVSRSEKELTARTCRTPELHSSRRPASRNSLNSRLSSSHNSLSVPAANKADDSSFITSAMSHDVLDLYNITLDGDIYTLPVDSLRPSCSKRLKRHRKRRKNTVFVEVDGAKTKVDSITVPSVVNTIDMLSDGIDVLRPDRPTTNSPMESNHYRSPVYSKRHSLPGPSLSGWVGRMNCNEPIHMTLQEVRRFLHNLYSSASSDPSWTDEQLEVNDKVTDNVHTGHCVKTVSGEIVQANNNKSGISNNNNNINNNNKNLLNNRKLHNNSSSGKHGFAIKIKNRKSKSFDVEPDTKSFNSKNNKHCCTNDSSANIKNRSDADSVLSPGAVGVNANNKSHDAGCGKSGFSYSMLKQTLCNIFRFRRSEMSVSSRCHHSMTDTVLVLGVSSRSREDDYGGRTSGPPPFAKRALPPLPSRNGVADDGENGSKVYDEHDRVEEGVGDGVNTEAEEGEEETAMDFATSIEKVKDYGWYWGPISGETAEKVLSNEPDGSFIVRDSSDDHYIFSLTFKLNGVIRHVRIEHDQGNFSFGSCAKFKSRTIVEFIENAVEHSRSGRYLFFLHRRPIHGPMRVQLLHPVSRFKQVQTLQHMCRFVILKVVRRDLIPSLPLPRRIIGYLNSPHYYCEHPSLPAGEDYPSTSPSLHLFSFVPPNS